MKKKIALSLVAMVAVVAGVAAMSAYEAHVINVTAKIENALSVDTTPIEFGTVFPQEKMSKDVTIYLSQSFLDEDRVDDVQYVVNEKPKPKPEPEPDRQLPILKPDYNMYLPGGQFAGELYPNWIDDDDMRAEYCHTHSPANVGDPMDLYYINCYPSLCGMLEVTSAETLLTGEPEQLGYLSKLAQDIQDVLDINLTVSGFTGMVDQAYTEEEYGEVLPPGLEHQTFGCDLWIEVTGISELEDLRPQ